MFTEWCTPAEIVTVIAVEHFRLGGATGNRPVKAGKAKVFVTDGKSVPLHGWCLVFTRTNVKIALNETNMPQVRAMHLPFVRHLGVSRRAALQKQCAMIFSIHCICRMVLMLCCC